MIGVFDSGYGGLTVLKEFVKLLPEYDYRQNSNNRIPATI
jgi:glutamate racemase